MSKIYLTSDLHFNHDREFIWRPRGFKSVEEMNQTIIERYNEIVTNDDDVYILGDMMLGGAGALQDGLKLIQQLNGKLHLVRGNHDTATRWDAFRYLFNVKEMRNSIYLDYNGYHFYLSHYPSITGTNNSERSIKKQLINLCGHTHTKNPFSDFEIGNIFHVELDAHNCYPISLEEIIFKLNN